jgi:hypothetical protein
MADVTADSRNWFLRISSGTIFGPVSMQGLVTWAEQGQVQAGNEVSRDRKQWQAAESLPELNISWYIEDADQQLIGPFHKRVAETIIAKGAGTGEGRLVSGADADLSRLRTTAAAQSAGVREGEHPELNLDPATPADNAPTDAAPAAWSEERESFRLRIAELEAQTRNLLRAAEKESRSRNRQIESARRQIASLEDELQALRQSPAEPDEPDADVPSDAEKTALEAALETARQEIRDLRQAAERESDTLHARISELEQQQAAAAAAEETAAALDRLRVEHAKQQNTLETERAEREALRGRFAALEQAAAADTGRLREQLDQQEQQIAARTEELGRLRSDQMQLQSARKDVEALKVRIAELIGQIAEHATTNEAIEELQARCTTLESSLRNEQVTYAELLIYSNSRDQEHQEAMHEAAGRQAALQTQLDETSAGARSLEERLKELSAQEPARLRELNARLREQETLLAGVLVEAQQVTNRLLASERESFTALRDSSVERQTLLQERLAALQKLRGGETRDVFEREAKVRTDRANSARTQDALATLQQDHARYVRQVEAREHELVNRIRLLELEEDRLKERVAEAEPLYQRNQRLTERLQDREQKLAKERQQRSIEQAQLEEAHQTLMDQIESRRQKDDRLPLTPGSGESAEPSALPARETFRAPPWMRLRK